MTIYSWDEAKRKSNLRKHGLDFADAPSVIENSDSLTIVDTRFHYDEERILTLGFSRGQEVAVIYTEHTHGTRIISFRKVTRRERATLLGDFQRLD